MLLAGFLSERFDHSDILQKSLKSTAHRTDRKSTRLNSSHGYISYAVFCLKKKKRYDTTSIIQRGTSSNRPPCASSMSCSPHTATAATICNHVLASLQSKSSHTD